MEPDVAGHGLYILVVGLLLAGSLVALRGASVRAGGGQERPSVLLRVALTAQCGCLGLVLLLVVWQTTVSP